MSSRNEKNCFPIVLSNGSKSAVSATIPIRISGKAQSVVIARVIPTEIDRIIGSPQPELSPINNYSKYRRIR